VCKLLFSSRTLLFCVSVLLNTFPPLLQQSLAENTVTIAIAGPMVGTSFSVGVQYKVGVTAALQTLTEELLLGRKIVLKVYDDNCQGPIAEKVAQNIVQDAPAVVIGHSCSGATIAAAPIYAQNAILQITPASTNPKVTELGINTLFRMIGRDDIQGKVAAERIATFHAGKKIGVFYFPGGYSEGLANAAIAALKQRGVIIAKQVAGVGSAASYVDNIEELTDAGIEVLYIVGGGLDSGVFLRQAHQLGAPFQVLSSDTLVSKVFIEAAGDAGEGIPFTFPPEAAAFSTSEPAVLAIKKMGLEPVGYTLLAYAATQTWIEGVRRANSFSADAVAAAIRQAPLETILGRISFDEKGDINTTYPPFSWFVWKDGKRIPLE
jgi:branched-chain amino acid transport system substrate-binding protein